MSYPAGAEVINVKDGTLIGITPTEYLWKNANSNNQLIALRFKKSEFRLKVSSFWLNMHYLTAEEAQQKPQVFEVSLEEK